MYCSTRACRCVLCERVLPHTVSLPSPLTVSFTCCKRYVRSLVLRISRVSTSSTTSHDEESSAPVLAPVLAPAPAPAPAPVRCSPSPAQPQPLRVPLLVSAHLPRAKPGSVTHSQRLSQVAHIQLLASVGACEPPAEAEELELAAGAPAANICCSERGRVGRPGGVLRGRVSWRGRCRSPRHGGSWRRFAYARHPWRCT